MTRRPRPHLRPIQPTSPTEPQQPPPPTPLTPEQLSSARLQLPMSVPDGMEAIAIRVNFMRSVAAVPLPGDRVNLYRLAPAERQPQD
jgi:Flp pilus assembly protein CpaB